MSEADRIRRLVERFGADPRLLVASGDDAAVVELNGGVSATSVDAVVENVHFTLPRWPLEAVARKAVGAALSDLAAMGALPGEIYVAVGLPQWVDEPAFERLADGLAAAAEAAGAVIAGGDMTASEVLWLSITVTGYAERAENVVTRTGAAAGDLLVVTGNLGGSRRALELIGRSDKPLGDDPRLAKQLSPQPRLAAGRVLATAGASAMIDVSDGLMIDAGRIAAPSGVALRVEAELLPLAEGVDDPASAAASGEEYELLASIPPERIDAVTDAVAATGTPLTRIGRVEAGSGARLVDASGVDLEVGGFDHFD